MSYFPKPRSFLIATLITFLLSCSVVSVKKPAELIAENDGNHSLILIRLTAEVNNKIVDTSIAGRGLGNAYSLTLTNLATGDTPESIYPRSDRSAAPSEQVTAQGWIYFTAASGDYDLAVATGRFTSAVTMNFLPQHYRLHVGNDAKVIYVGSFFTKCRDSILPDCDAASPPVDESLKAETIVKDTMAYAIFGAKN